MLRSQYTQVDKVGTDASWTENQKHPEKKNGFPFLASAA